MNDIENPDKHYPDIPLGPGPSVQSVIAKGHPPGSGDVSQNFLR